MKRRSKKKTELQFRAFFRHLLLLPGAGVAGGGGGFGLFPNVVKAVELTPNRTINTAKSIVKLPHCVNLFNGCIFFSFFSLYFR